MHFEGRLLMLLSGGKVNDFLTIRSHSFCNHLMHEQLAFKTQIVVHKPFNTFRSRWTEWIIHFV